jgi:acetyl esterase/lipase
VTYAPPPFDPELADLLSEPQAFMAPDGLRPETILELRTKLDEWPMPSLTDLERDGRFKVFEVGAPTDEEAATVSLLICQPGGSGSDDLPAVYYVHGGGMVMGNSRFGMDFVLDWADQLNLAVVSVDYRLAPEFPHPIPIEDCLAGLRWLQAAGAEHGIDPHRIVVAGDSGGGGLAASLALLARDRGGPPILGQVLGAPMLDDRNDTLSAQQMAGSPTYLDVGSAETFRDEVVTFASRIWAAGGEAELHVWPGGFHGYYFDVPAGELSMATQAARVAWLRRLLSR